jgi:exonuclease SbcD
VAVLPWAKPSSLVEHADGQADAIQQTVAALLDITRGLAGQLDLTRQSILIGHWAVSGCQTSSGLTLFGEEPTLPLAELQALPFQAAIMGHIHKPQVWAGLGQPPVVHTGALERRDFGEERDLRGAYIVDLDTGEAAWHDLPARRFLTINLEVGGEIESILHECALHGQPATGAIVRARYRATEEEAKRFDHAATIKAIQDAGAHYVAGVFPEVTRGERSREASVTESTGPIEALEKCLATRPDLSERMGRIVVLAAQTLLEEVQA